MATSSTYIAADQGYDYCCSKCKEHCLNVEAQYCCSDCENYLCDECVKLHNGYHKKHTVYGREDIQKWTGFAIDRCDKHGKELEVHCDDHQEPCCHVCATLYHRWLWKNATCIICVCCHLTMECQSLKMNILSIWFCLKLTIVCLIIILANVQHNVSILGT